MSSRWRMAARRAGRKRGFALSSGGGALIDWSANGTSPLGAGRPGARSFDNHLRRVSSFDR